MEFWPENQGQSPLYSKFGTVPGRNCSHNYHDRHQAPHYPLYYGEQQDQGRDSSYWTVPGSRTGGAPQEYTNWTDQELTNATSSHFPFMLERHVQQHQDLGDYQPHEARDREWTAAQRAAREYERGFLREGWQRRWEPCGPVRYNREVSAKRSDSSYRELEAWAARYSHSLPRRRRIEAELRGASQGLLESSRAPERDSRCGADPRVATLQQVRQSANIRESGLWDRGGRQQAQTFYPLQAPAIDTSHMLDIKEKTGYQRRVFSQPPGYIAPPPYDSPHKGSPVLHHSEASWEQEGKRQTYWSQPTLRKQDVSVDVQDHNKGEREELTKPDVNPKSFQELEGLRQQRQETDALQASSPLSVQQTHIQHEGVFSLQQQQVLQAVESKKINEEPSSKVIEGRKFRLNKKRGGMTIFCLVSRIAGTTETESLPLCTLQTSIQNTELRGVSASLRESSDNNQTHKLPDEVDFRAPTLTEQSNTSDARNVKQKEMPTCVESEMLEDNLSNKAGKEVVSAEKANTSADSTFGRQVAQAVQPASVRYPLWREPSITSRAETESSATCLKANSEEEQSDVLQNQEDSGNVHPIDAEVRRLDINADTESEDNNSLLVIDTTCVVVKMELIPSPKKEHVHYLHTEDSPLVQSTVSPECVQSDNELNQDLTTDQTTETNHINERSETEPDSDLMTIKAPEGESEISDLCMPKISSTSVSERETLEERAERILGIPLDDCITKQQTEDETSLLDSCVENQEVEPPTIREDNGTDGAAEQIPEDTKEEERSQNQLEVSQTEGAECLQEHDDAEDEAPTEGGGDDAGLQDQVLNTFEDNDSQLQTDIKPSPEIEITEDPVLQPASEEGKTEQEENATTALSTSSPPSPDCETPNPTLSLVLSSSDLSPLTNISESNTEKGPEPELVALNLAESLAPHPETPSPLTTVPNDFSPSSIPCTDHSPDPPPLDSTDQIAKAVSGIEDQDEEGETSQLINNEISDALEDSTRDPTEELVSEQQLESVQPDDQENVSETEEVGGDSTDDVMEETLNISEENGIEAVNLQQQLECIQAEEVVCVKESYMTEEQLPEEFTEDPTGVFDQTTSQEYMTDSQTQAEVNILQHQFDNAQEEDASLKESYMTEEQLPEEFTEDPTGVFDQTISQEYVTDSQTQAEVNILQHQFDNAEEEDASLKESYMTEEQSQTEADEDPTGLLEQTLTTESATDSQTQIEIEVLQEPQTEPSHSSPPAPSDSHCGVSQSPLDVLSPSLLPSPPHTSLKFVSPLEMDSVCPSALNPDAAPAAGIPETLPPPLHVDSCEETLQFSSSSCTDLLPVLSSSSLTLSPQEGSGSADSDSPLKEEPQYPMSLWDAVNRIRKHTAPDSENEEEEVGELWDPESAAEDLGCPDVMVGMNPDKTLFDGVGQLDVSTKGSVEDSEAGQIQEDPCHDEPSGHAEDDTLSCSSTSSHGSGDTVIVADEDEVEETPPDAEAESKAGNDEEFQMSEGEQCCSAEVKDEPAAKEEGDNDGDEGVTDESGQSEEVENVTVKAVEITEPELEENEAVVPSEISDVGMIESESAK